jgi:hypothetical protein
VVGILLHTAYIQAFPSTSSPVSPDVRSFTAASPQFRMTSR